MNRLSLVPVRVEQRRGDRLLGHGTGFLVRPPSDGRQVWLVTAWHVVTARIPTEPARTIDGYQEGPDTLWFRTLLLPGMPQWSMLHSSRVDLTPETVWREHKNRALGVDIVALHLPWAYRPVSFDLPWAMVEGGSAPVAGTDAMIVGFPFSYDAAGTKDQELDPPIWKRATVASEPRSSAYGENRFLVDALSVPGMSGAPIFRVRHAGELVLDKISEGLTEQYNRGAIGFDEYKADLARAALSESPQAAQHYEFAGVYTGRLTAGGLGRDLGIAVVPEVIVELFEYGVSARHPVPQSLPESE